MGASPELVTAFVGLAGVMVGSMLTTGTNLWIDHRKRQAEQRKSGQHARGNRESARAKAVDACMVAATRYRSIALAFQAGDATDKELLTAEAELDVARLRLGDTDGAALIEQWQILTRDGLSDAANAGDIEAAWRAGIAELGQQWNRHLDEVEHAASSPSAESPSIPAVGSARRPRPDSQGRGAAGPVP